MTMLSSAPADSALRSPADLVVADRRIAGLSWSAYRSVLDTLIARAALERGPRRPGETGDIRPREQRVVREYLSGEDGEGYWDYFQLNDALSLSVTDATYRRAHWISVEGGRFFKVRVLLSGKLLQSDGAVMLQGPHAQLHVCAGERGGGYAIAGGGATKLVVLHCAPELLTRRLGFAPGEAPYPLRALTSCAGAAGRAVTIRLTPELLRAAQWIDTSRFSVLPAVRTVYLEALAMQLLCHTVTELSGCEVHAHTSIPPRDLKRIHEARDHLAQHYASPPTIPQLARVVGMNQTKLKAGFKQTFQQTIYAYILQRRMEATAQLLAEREFSVAEIAYRVGYEYPANFSCAFKRYYGCSPRQWKRT